MPKREHHQVVVVGGGTAGITVAALLSRKMPRADVVIIDPATWHYYQPLWTLVGAGVYPKEVTQRPEASLIPSGVGWIQDAVTEFYPDEHSLVTKGGKQFGYDYLVVAPGIQIDWDKVKGLKESIGKDGVCSNYAFEYVEKTWEFMRNFKGGHAVFTKPNTPIKCGGAPQKIVYLADEYWRRSGVREKTKMTFALNLPTIFEVKKYAPTLEKVIARKGIETLYEHHLVEIRPQSREAVFENLQSGEETVLKYDFLHVTPPMSAPDFIKESPLADDEGWVDVNLDTLQHKTYFNVFGLGDASNLPTSKTGAAIRKQVPVLVNNLLSCIKGEPLTAKYNGYTACPLVTGYRSVVLAEFDYDKHPQETFPFDQSKERYSMFLLKKYLLPLFYWKGMLKGKML